MEKAAAQKAKSIEETLWVSVNKLRSSVEPSKYKHVVLSLIFLKVASEKFEHRRQELVGEGRGISYAYDGWLEVTKDDVEPLSSFEQRNHRLELHLETLASIP
jgi:type I restriction-modification system DNA methylase subunit